MPAAKSLEVTRVSDDVFRIVWTDWRGSRREELATKATLTHRCHVLTYQDGLDVEALMRGKGPAPMSAEALYATAADMDHAP